MSAPGCHLCDLTTAVYCDTCVRHAISDRTARLAEFKADAERLQRVMESGLARRQRQIEQQAAVRKHEALVSRLAADLAAARGEADRRAQHVNELRHRARRARPAMPSAPTAEAAGLNLRAEGAAGESARKVEARERLTALRRRLIAHLLEMHQFRRVTTTA